MQFHIPWMCDLLSITVNLMLNAEYLSHTVDQGCIVCYSTHVVASLV